MPRKAAKIAEKIPSHPSLGMPEGWSGRKLMHIIELATEEKVSRFWET